MAHEFRLPDIGEGLTDAEIIHWFVAVGDTISVDDPVVEVETAKTTVEITATHGGTILQLGGAPGETINVGDVLFVVGDPSEVPDTGSPEAQPAPQPKVETVVATRQGPAHGRTRAMPIVRKLAKEKGVDLSAVEGTGPGGSITRADVEKAAQQGSAETLTSLTRIRKAIARHMTESWTTIPHVTVQAEIRAEDLLTARTSRGGRPIPIEAIVGRLIAPLLARYREFNASMHDDIVEFRSHINLGFAVDTAAGLMVVVVKNADSLSVDDLAMEFERLAAAAISGSLKPDEAVGQTFTISNIGALGGGHGTPIIPLGTSAILSIGRARQTPVVEDGEVAVGMVAPLDLSYDHRLIDGSLGQRFLADLVTSLERATALIDAEG